MKKGLFTFLLFSTAAVSANVAVFYTSQDEAYPLDIQYPSTVWEIKEVLEEALPYPKEEMLFISDGVFLCEEEYFLPYDGQEIWVTTLMNDQPVSKKTYAGYRDYNLSATDSEKEDLRFILKTMATKSVAGLLKYRSELEAATSAIRLTKISS